MEELPKSAAGNPTPLKDAIAKLETIPGREGEIGVVATKDDAGVVGRVSQPIGKDWSLAAEGSWWQRAGYRVAGLLRWKGGSR
jgi:hypothetical protein